MCSGITTTRFKPGKILSIQTRSGQYNMRWGFGNGAQYNARLDRLHTTWREVKANRGILRVESFWEGGKEFTCGAHGIFNVGILYSQRGEFAILTVDSNSIVKPYHARMPLLLQDNNVPLFLSGKLDFDELPETEVTLRGQSKIAV